MHRIHPLSPFARMTLTAAGLAVALAGCGGDRIFATRGVPAAALEATLVRLPNGSVSVHAVASNTGSETIQAGANCNDVWIEMSVRGPAGSIRLVDPCALAFYCTSGFVPLEPGDRAERDFSYDGHQYGDTCNSPSTIAPGSYEVVVNFGWRARGVPVKTLTRRLSFDWPAP
jgi:hypothetical protein